MKENPIVYRVQDRDGRGPWKPGFSMVWVEDREDLQRLLPWYEEFGRVDHLGIYGMVMGSACRTLQQLRRWFTPKEYATLRRHGYRAVKLKVGRLLASSDVQCVFERAKPLNVDVEPVELYPGLSGWLATNLRAL
jgi:hypothetical protein